MWTNKPKQNATEKTNKKIKHKQKSKQINNKQHEAIVSKYNKKQQQMQQ